MTKIHSTKENLQVLYEDNHLIIINKRAGDIVQGDKTGDKPLSDVVKDYIKAKYNKPGKVFLGVVHRLDRPTSGLVIFAKTSKALERMNALFRDKKISKTYMAITTKKEVKPKGTLINFLRKNPKNNKSTAFDKEIAGSKKAVLHYEISQALDNYLVLKIGLETGRHHQIRCQLAKIGLIIKGDLKYGAKRSNKNGGIHLHAREITFVHPVKKEPLTVKAPFPKDAIWDLV